MPRLRRSALSATALAVVALTLAACASSEPTDADDDGQTTETVSIEDNHGTVEVPVDPQVVVALDNHVFETLAAWDVPLAAVPKDIMGDIWPVYTDDEEVLNVGAHFEPNLEAIVAAQPDLIIAGYRFGDAYDDIVAQNPDAVVIEINPREGEDFTQELIRQTEILGAIFDRGEEAQELIEGLEASIADAEAAYDGTSTVTTLLTTGGEISYVAPVNGRTLGLLYPALSLVPAIETEGSADHEGDDISVEAIVAANPDWLIVMDREGAMTDVEGYVPAAEVIEGSEALQTVTAVQEGQVIYVDANIYLTEDIQTYTGVYAQLAEAFGAAS